MSNKIVIIGGGIGGLAVALALKRTDCQVVIIERDPAPPDIAPEDAFERWARPGVPQFRHAHILLSRLQTILRDRHPELLQELLAAGMELSKLDEIMPSGVVQHMVMRPEDEDLRHLWGRRATFEYVLRRHVGALPHVSFLHDTRVVGLRHGTSGQQVRITGVDTQRGHEHDSITADVIVDASGKRSQAEAWLKPLGVHTQTKGADSGFIYACRHYRLREVQDVPSRRDCGGNLDYLGYSTFFAERGNYALTFGSPADEKELVAAMGTADGFEFLTSQFPTIRRWRDASQATSKVLGAGRFQNRWRRYGVGGGKTLLGFFAVGDSLLETNPMYGRGCAAAFVQADLLAELLRSEPDAKRRARRYAERVHQLLDPYYQISLSTDRIYHARARRRRGLPVPLGERLICYLYDAALMPATHESPLVAREFIKAVQMREPSPLWLRLAMAAGMMSSLMRTWRGRKLPYLSPPPERREFIARILGAQQEKAS